MNRKDPTKIPAKAAVAVARAVAPKAALLGVPVVKAVAAARGAGGGDLLLLVGLRHDLVGQVEVLAQVGEALGLQVPVVVLPVLQPILTWEYHNEWIASIRKRFGTKCDLPSTT